MYWTKFGCKRLFSITLLNKFREVFVIWPGIVPAFYKAAMAFPAVSVRVHRRRWVHIPPFAFLIGL